MAEAHQGERQTPEFMRLREPRARSGVFDVGKAEEQSGRFFADPARQPDAQPDSMSSSPPCPAPRILVIEAMEFAQGADHARALGFTDILVTGTVPAGNFESAAPDIRVWIDLAIDALPLDHPLVVSNPEAFAIRRKIADGPVDPRVRRPPRGQALARFGEPAAEAVVGWWIERICDLAASGVGGFIVRRPDAPPATVWRRIFAATRTGRARPRFLADTTGLSRKALRSLEGAGFDFCLSSLPWWDGRASWLLEEHRALAAVAPVIAPVATPGNWQAAPENRMRQIALAAATGAGWMMPDGFEQTGSRDLSDHVRATNALFESEPALRHAGALQPLTGPGAPITAILRADGADMRAASRAVLALVNPDMAQPQRVDRAILSNARADFGFARPSDAAALEHPLAAGEVRLLTLRRGQPIAASVKRGREAARAAANAPRIVIGGVSPAAGGGYAVKRIVGERLVVEADIFADGHEQIAARLLLKADDGRGWQRADMEPLGNDRWRGQLPLERLGRYAFVIEAWIDVWGGYVRDLAKKQEAGLDLSLEISEGIALMRAAGAREKGRNAALLRSEIDRIAAAAPSEQAALLLSDSVRRLMADADDRPFRAVSPGQAVEADRLTARFASWYELFPRSQTDDPARHGTLRDVIARLPDIARMGFDVLYFPPIHPIGHKNRKGRNNSTTAAPGDPGSPYGIGSADGGHDAIHPELGGIEDFRALISAARDHGIEIALDFAVQCSPDHPWLKDHPGWFAWRPDGSIKYAENPPKKYQDIVNVDFYAADAIPDLWLALRDVILFWAAENVRIFRVDNPHTKPLPFWRWLIAEVRAVHPDAIFLAEAFTRPKIMDHLAKIGFSQSYTYFTWRNDKAELTEYLTELTTTAASEYFRPHFFVNTPDINPYFLQRSGRAGFLIRAALAATLSGLWGVYSGFELCEWEPLPGREEYLDSEKYEIRPRDWSRPGNIIAEIAALNRIRRAEPALQTHLGVTFYNAFNDRILYFGKVAAGQNDKILVAVSLDPHQPQAADFEVPLWEWGFPDQAAVDVTDLLNDARFAWRGKIQHVRLTPDAPYAIWRAQPQHET
jgi:starch synthase (maltosyl-transferring)